MLSSQVDALERVALEVLSSVRSMKNNFAPVNRIPGAILSLIPKYLRCDCSNADNHLIKLTHVCRGWRALFISRPSLWTRLDFTDVKKTRVYLERSQHLPLEVVINKSDDEPFIEDALVLAVPHVNRFKSLAIGGTSDFLPSLANRLNSPAPFLKELTVDFHCVPAPILNATLFGGDLSSLRALSLGGVVTNLPWKNLGNLTSFMLCCPSNGKVSVAKLLNFFECAPRLEGVTIHSIPRSSNASSTLVVCLPNLKTLNVVTDRPHSVLLNHLSIPEKASLTLEFNFQGNESPLPLFLPKRSKNLKNTFRITTVNLLFTETEKLVQLGGPSGKLRTTGHRKRAAETDPTDIDSRIFQSLNYFSLHMTRTLTITKYKAPSPPLDEIEEFPPYEILLRMKDLRTLVLTKCNNLSFILSLNPNLGSSKGPLLCPNLEKLVLYIKKRDDFHISGLVNMAKKRASRGAKLRSVIVVGLDELVSGREVLKLREHVGRVEYRFEEYPPKWDSVPDEDGD